MSWHEQSEGLRCFDTRLTPFPLATENHCVQETLLIGLYALCFGMTWGQRKGRHALIHLFINSFPSKPLLSPYHVSVSVSGTGIST